MRITKKSWIMDWDDYRDKTGHGPATTYYHKEAIAEVLNFHSKARYTADNLPAPDARWNNYQSVGALVAEICEPYRVVR